MNRLFSSSSQLSPKEECFLPSLPCWYILNVSPHKMIPQSKILFYRAGCPQKSMKLFELVTVFQSAGIGVENHRQISPLLSKVSAFFFFFPRKIRSRNMWRSLSVCYLSAVIFVWVGRKTEIELPSESYHVHSHGKDDFVKDDILNRRISNFLVAQHRLSKRKGRASSPSDTTERVLRGQF